MIFHVELRKCIPRLEGEANLLAYEIYSSPIRGA
jgi:hypothetical protein